MCLHACICVYTQHVHMCACVRVYKWMCAHGGQKLMSDIFQSPLYYFCLRQGLSLSLKLVISQGGQPEHQSYLFCLGSNRIQCWPMPPKFSHGCLNSDSRLSCVHTQQGFYWLILLLGPSCLIDEGAKILKRQGLLRPCTFVWLLSYQSFPS